MFSSWDSIYFNSIDSLLISSLNTSLLFGELDISGNIKWYGSIVGNTGGVSESNKFHINNGEFYIISSSSTQIDLDPGSGVTMSNPKGGTDINLIKLSDGTSSLLELNPNQDKELVKIVNILGQETTFKRYTPLIYIYSDGSAKKVFSIE